MSEEYKVGKGLTLKVLAIGLLLVIIITGYHNLIIRNFAEGIVQLLRYDNIREVYQTDRYFYRVASSWPISIGFFMTVNLLAAYLIKNLRKKPLSPELVIFSIMLSTCFFYNFIHGPNCSDWGKCWDYNVIGLAAYWHRASSGIWTMIPSLISPKDPSVYSAVVPVSTWSIHPAFYPSMVWSILYYTSMTMAFLSLSMILKIIWFDVENIPSLWAEIQAGAISLVQTENVDGGGKVGKVKWFMIGFLISAAYAILAHGYGVYAALINPVQAGPVTEYNGFLFGTPIRIAPVFDLTPLGLLPWVPLFVSFMPHHLGFAYLLPIDVSLSCLIGYFIFMMLIPVTFSQIGMFPSSSSGYAWPDVSKRMLYESYVGGSWARGIYTVLPIGMLLAIVIYPLYVNRKRVKRIFRSAFGKPDPELEALSPLPLRIVVTLMICSMIVWFSCWIALEADVKIIILTLLINTLIVIGATRVVVYTGGNHFLNTVSGYGAYFGRGPWKFAGGFSLLYFGPKATPTPAGWATTAVAGMRTLDGWMDRQIEQMAFSLYNFRIGNALNLRKRDVGLALLVTFLVMPIVATPFAVLRFHIWPFYEGGPLGMPHGSVSIYTNALSNVYGKLRSGDWDDETVRFQFANIYKLGTQGIIQIFGYLTLGFAIVSLIYFARRRLPWLRLLPEGILIGIFMGESCVIPALFVGLILKYLTFKAGLVEDYNNKISPLCMGLVVGFFVPISILWFLIAFYSYPTYWLYQLSRV
ncbi:MAG: DUF6785 family protein [Nitrososphaerota archaeon]|nr:hypothetical protein [Candidatus Bathyarchaeota archaeon]MDW8049126.1 DUF6785 family protein [Nitrososphaerota archaeon]